ncbi:MAG: 5'-methylthioadenosine/S-adenosylhomocysteine nucleosidase [Clostridia bacterium]|nr:5'-methylthioadenosine/S-adenosylhomocysteine nucleosidase [Clostridia bacterium]
MVGIVVAMEKESKFVFDNIINRKPITICGKEGYTGTLFGEDVVAVISGIGKVNAGMATQCLIDKFNPKYILNFGTAGGIDNSIKVADFMIIEKCCQFDFDLSSIDPVPVGYLQDYNGIYFNAHAKDINFLKKCNLATADRFSFDPKDIDLIKKLGCSLRDMEGGAIGEVCTANKVPFVMIKGVTDIYGNPSNEFYENLMYVCGHFPAIIERVMNTLTIRKVFK